MFRSATPTERATFTRLLSEQFPGRNQLLEQVQTVEVDVDSSPDNLLFRVTAGQRADVIDPIPVEAEFVDQ